MKRTLLFSVIAASVVVGSYGARALDGFGKADNSLALAALEAQGHLGGTVLHIDRNSGDPSEPYAAVTFSQNGILHHVHFALPVDQILPSLAVTLADFTHTRDMATVKVSIADAIRTAESIAGAPANSAEFVESANHRELAYRVMFGNPSGNGRIVLIDARTGEQLHDAGKDFTT